MASTQQKREWWADWRCNRLKMTAVVFPGSGRNWNLPVADTAAPAFELFASLMRKHGYLFRESAGGTYNCRYIGGTTSWSLHAYGIAIDLNPSKNPFGTTRHDFPQGFIDDVLATGLFRWGMDFKDPMHWEIDVPPSAVNVPPPPIEEEEPEDMAFSKGLSEAQWRNLYQLKIAKGSSEQAVVDYWMNPARTDSQHEKVSAELFETLAELQTAGVHNHDGRYVRDVSVAR